MRCWPRHSCWVWKRMSPGPRTLRRTTRVTLPARRRLSLGPEFEGMAGRQLRLRLLTIEPGGYIGLHNHKDRPAVVYFLQGTDTVIRDDGTSQTFKPGDTTGEPGTTVHWHRNDGTDAVILITADIFKAPPK